jgi:hypothetical protein
MAPQRLSAHPKRRPNHRLVKIHRSYTVEEAALLFGSHKNTVRAWIKSGLPVSDARRPILILGRDLAAFLQLRRAKKKRPCGPGEMYCMRCRVPRTPAGCIAEYQPRTESLGNLVGICPECEAMMYRRVSFTKLEQVRGRLDVSITEAERHISERRAPTVNSENAKEL